MFRFFFFFLVLVSNGVHADRVTRHLKKMEGKIEKTSTIDKIDYIYLINLDQRSDRLQSCLAQFQKYGISAHRFPAIYGWTLPLETWNDIGIQFLPEMSFINNGWPEHSDIRFLPGKGERIRLDASCYGKTCFHADLCPGTVGCTLSHLSILKDAYESNYQIIWVLEDDFLIQGDPHLLTGCIEKLDTLVGREGWDILYTDRRCGLDTFESSHDCWRPDLPLFDQNSMLKSEDLFGYFTKIGGRARTHSMLITRSGMKKVLDFMCSQGLFNAVDGDLAFVPEINLYCLTEDLITWVYLGSDAVYKNFE